MPQIKPSSINPLQARTTIYSTSRLQAIKLTLPPPPPKKPHEPTPPVALFKGGRPTQTKAPNPSSRTNWAHQQLWEAIHPPTGDVSKQPPTATNGCPKDLY